MARRRASGFRGYARRRWRTITLTLAVAAGTLLFLHVSDPGHDPLWMERPGEIARVALSPDGATTYALVKNGSEIRELRAYDASAGDLLWARPLNVSSPALPVAPGDGWVAIATPFPNARIVALRDTDGEVVYQRFLDGNPRALAANGDVIAYALQEPPFPVVVLRNFTQERVHAFDAFVLSLAVSDNGRVAAGTGAGELVVYEGATDVLNTSRPFSVRSVSLSADGSKLIAGGFSLSPGDFSGGVEFFDLDDPVPDVPKWSHRTIVGVGFVQVSPSGAWALAVEQITPENALHFFNTTTREPLWTYRVGGIIHRESAGEAGGVALSPDGRLVAVAPLDRGDIEVLQTHPEFVVAWRFEALGSTSVAFAQERSDHLAANARVTRGQPTDAVMTFDATEEPFTKRHPQFALALAGLVALAGLGSLVVGYAWDRR